MMTIPEILAEFSTDTGKFPHRAMKAAMRQAEIITPVLLEELEKAAADPAAYAEGNSEMHLYAIHFLAWRRERRAFVNALKLFAAPGEMADYLWGDTLTEGMPRLLGSLYDGDPAPLKQLVENEAANQWARGGAIRTFAMLAHLNLLGVDQVENYLRELYQGKLPLEPDTLWWTLVDVTAELGLQGLREEARQAFESNKIGDDFWDFEDFEKDFNQSPVDREKRLAKEYALLEDPITEMSRWACYSEDSNDTDPPSDHWAPPNLDDTYGLPDGPVPFLAPPKVGRNDPCPCGSGKKYKKCCLDKA